MFVCTACCRKGRPCNCWISNPSMEHAPACGKWLELKKLPTATVGNLPVFRSVKKSLSAHYCQIVADLLQSTPMDLRRQGFSVREVGVIRRALNSLGQTLKGEEFSLQEDINGVSTLS